MSILTGLGSSTGLAAGGAAVVTAAAVAGFLIFGSDDKPPVVGGAPVQLSGPDIDIVATSSTTDETTTSRVQATIEVSADDAAPVVNSEDIAIGNAVVGEDTSPIAKGGDVADTTASRISNNVIASVDPADTLSVSTDPSKKPEVGAVTTGLGLAGALKFDLVRIDKFGSTVVAGKAPPEAPVEIFLNGEVIAKVQADAKGSFVALFDIPMAQQAQVMTMAMRDGAGALQPSTDRVLVMGREVVSTAPATENAPSLPNDEAAPQVIIATDEGVKVLQPASIEQGAPEVMANVSLDLISYDTEGEVVLAGQSDPDKHVRVYVNDKPVKTQSVAEDGSWTIKIPEVDAGQYTLRVDEIDPQGNVTSRLETPFQKENPEAVKKVASIGALTDGQGPEGLPSVQQIIIQPGATLWAVAEATYGQGDLYMQIFDANKSNIKNPDLIYPGQIFEIPD